MGKKKRLERSYGFVHKLRVAPFANKPTATEHWPFTSSQQSCKLENNLAREEEYEPLTPEEKCDTLVLHNFTTF